MKNKPSGVVVTVADEDASIVSDGDTDWMRVPKTTCTKVSGSTAARKLCTWLLHCYCSHTVSLPCPLPLGTCSSHLTADSLLLIFCDNSLTVVTPWRSIINNILLNTTLLPFCNCDDTLSSSSPAASCGIVHLIIFS